MVLRRETGVLLKLRCTISMKSWPVINPDQIEFCWAGTQGYNWNNWLCEYTWETSDKTVRFSNAAKIITREES